MKDKTNAQIINMNVDGYFLTNMARQMLYNEGKYKDAYELLYYATQCDELSEVEHQILIYDILNGKKEISGNTANGTYTVIECENKENTFTNLNDFIENLVKKNKKLEKENLKYQKERNFLISNFLEAEPKVLSKILNEYKDYFDEEMLSKEEKEELCIKEDSIISDKPKEKTSFFLSESYKFGDYGWLSPSGIFYPVAFGEHDGWAREYILKHYNVENELELFEAFKCGDFLTKQHWILLHNPSWGIAQVSMQEGYQPTKAQKDFLFTYYAKRNKYDLANKWFID